MVPFIYRCPATGLNVQGLSADKVPAENAECNPSNRQIGNVPQADDSVLPGGQDAHAVRGECEAPNITLVVQRLDALPGIQVPEVGRAARAAGNEKAATIRQRKVVDRLSGEDRPQLAGGHGVPEYNLIAA